MIRWPFWPFNYISVLTENIFQKYRVYKWKIKILRTKNYEINVGIAPIDIKFDSLRPFQKGWFYYCCDSNLYSGPPHNFAPEKTHINSKSNEIVAIMDMPKRTLKYIIDNKEIEAYTDIPLDKPIAPCVTLYNTNDSIQILEA